VIGVAFTQGRKFDVLRAFAKGPHKTVHFVENGKKVGKASFGEGDLRPEKVWTRLGPLSDSETPRHVTDASPLIDQQNKGGWTSCDPMSDEFEGNELDRSKMLEFLASQSVLSWTGHCFAKLAV
jgi:hypothetical protein